MTGSTVVLVAVGRAKCKDVLGGRIDEDDSGYSGPRRMKAKARGASAGMRI